MKSKLNFCITAGSTEIDIDKVRVISNRFHGKTGTELAIYLFSLGHDITLITSNKELAVKAFENYLWENNGKPYPMNKFYIEDYRTFSELELRMRGHIRSENFDVIIHSSAVSDYYVGAIRIPYIANILDRIYASWEVLVTGKVTYPILPRDKKVSSEYKELLFDMWQTEKLIGKIRKEWGYEKKLVMFKLEVGLTDEELNAVAIGRKNTFDADFIVSNHFETHYEKAFIIGKDDIPEKIARHELPEKLYKRIEEAIDEDTAVLYGKCCEYLDAQDDKGSA
jgi:phosphopantothenoylcysteine synthetase/decarboxylase